MRITLLCVSFLCTSALKVSPFHEGEDAQDIISRRMARRFHAEVIKSVGTMGDKLALDPLDEWERACENSAASYFEPSDKLQDMWAKHGKASLKASSRNIPEECKSFVAHAKPNAECSTPRVTSKMCQQAYEIPNYRLGDLFNQYVGYVKNKVWTQTMFPHSIGANYEATKTRFRDYKGLRKVIDSPQYADYEKPSDDTVVVHFRGYDVLVTLRSFSQKEGWGIPQTISFPRDVTQATGNAGSLSNYVKKAAKYVPIAERAAELGFHKAVILTGDHWMTQMQGLGWDKMPDKKKQVDKAMAETKKRIDELKEVFTTRGFDVKVRNNWNADCDFVYMSNAKVFVSSGGTFDALVGEMVKKNNQTVWNPDAKHFA